MKLQHPCQKDEHTSKLSVQCLFEKIGGFVTWWNWNPRLLLRESCGGALLFHNLHFRPHPYDRSNRIDTARRCHCCHILMLIQNFWEIASNHQCIILSYHHLSVEETFTRENIFPWLPHLIPTIYSMKHHGPVKSFCIPPCRKNERSSKLSVQRFFRKYQLVAPLPDACNPRLLSVFLLHHSKLP